MAENDQPKQPPLPPLPEEFQIPFQAIETWTSIPSHQYISRRVQEHTIKVCGKIAESEKSVFLERLIRPSTKVAAERGESLTLIRPVQSRFYWKKKKGADLERERRAYQYAARQLSLLDQELIALVPCPFEFCFDYKLEDDVPHTATCDDWETTAMFNKFTRLYGEQAALAQMSRAFNQEYPAKGMAFAMGTHSRFPEVWLLVGVLRVDKINQLAFAI